MSPKAPVPPAPPRFVDYLRTAAFYGVSIALAVPFLLIYPLILLPERTVFRICALYLRLQSGAVRYLCGIRYRITGLENLPDGPVLIASQHESTWETLHFQYLLNRPVMYAKEEIFSFPVFGPLTRKLGHIPVARAGGGDALREGFRNGADTVAAGRNLLIFPSGTRRTDGTDALQTGVGVLYQLAKAPLVPVRVASGHCWPSGTALKFPGTIEVEVLPPIPEGLPRTEVMQQLRTALEQPSAPSEKEG
ncbi:lysophospholipid acyltransferase family protein [Shimia sp. Alg240-R146]|uniref:lysophospholipid acyltransferase family protein n=1 Tax=Shimia sp. Alg240-R146 TaxID=2993449 RepID=UPI0022DEAA32|nr:lysophospholipid acyltransferase family protein [Shimia sp. Alg240-R146]